MQSINKNCQLLLFGASSKSNLLALDFQNLHHNHAAWLELSYGVKH